MDALERGGGSRGVRWGRVAGASAVLAVVVAGGFAGAVRADLVPRPAGWPQALSPSYVDERGCPTGEGDAIIDWVAFVWFDGRQYEAWTGGKEPETVSAARVGNVLGEITCSLPSTGSADSALGPPSYPDGTAPFVPVGTPIHGLRGVSGACAVVIDLFGKPTVYHAMTPGASRPTRACPG
ncbi:hypothetical protein [Actinocorallia sp. A-T 12471]|uniref:hypothetical protein n=1 Tax=Actinocorallia sp. A-T 12471 TaxID=3089813 RepID=UPI0029D2193F|nr:hypothetical protein [Actinocorallia sp. A-T 12471]MDX6738331.1 hypothetical protein [Actinocorallia sp. A-T 12471]